MLHLTLKLFRYVYSYSFLVGLMVDLLLWPFVKQYSEHTIGITIQFDREIPDAKLQLKVSADIREAKFEITSSAERTVRRVSDEKM